VTDLSGPAAVIAECDENLCGTNLSAVERALFTARRKEAYEALHPETKRGGNQGDDGKFTPSRQVGDTARFTADTARKTGQSERKVQRDAGRGERIEPDVRAKEAGKWQSPAIADGASCGPGRLAVARPRNRPPRGSCMPGAAWGRWSGSGRDIGVAAGMLKANPAPLSRQRRAPASPMRRDGRPATTASRQVPSPSPGPSARARRSRSCQP
jgi:hypothetical protein